MSTTFPELLALLRDGESFVVGSHVAPDPDAIGSSAALALGLRSLGKKAVVYLGDELSSRISWAVPEGLVVSELPEGSDFVALVTDTASRPRVSGDRDALLATAKSSINVDHHISNTLWADANYIDGAAAASTSIVLEILEQLEVDITKEMATLLMMGLVDDTGSFRFGNTTELTLARAGRLVKYGASLAEIANHLYFSIPRNQISLKAEALQAVEYFCDGRFAFVSVDSKMMERHNAVADDTEGIVDAVRAVEGVLVAVFAREIDNGWKLSLRSCDERISILEVAAHFGGGGHRMASGARVPADLKVAKEKMVELISPLLVQIS